MLAPLLPWLVLYAGLFAAAGFLLVVGRAASGRPRSTLALLRAASLTAFVLALVVWLVLVLID